MRPVFAGLSAAAPLGFGLVVLHFAKNLALSTIVVGLLAVGCGSSSSTDSCGEHVPYTYLGAGYGYGYGGGWYGGGGYYGGWTDPYGGDYGDPDAVTADDDGDDDESQDDDSYDEDDPYDDSDYGGETDSFAVSLQDTSGTADACRAHACTMVCALGSPATLERSAQGFSRHGHRQACDAAVRGLAAWAAQSGGRLSACRSVENTRIPATPSLDAPPPAN